MKKDHRFSGSGAALHYETLIQGSADNLILVTLYCSNDIGNLIISSFISQNREEKFINDLLSLREKGNVPSSSSPSLIITISSPDE